ncbi:glycosyltransferase family 9 protein [Sulfuricurvum sp.]|uniref:glycosyltransferase family 9 protein n=1 Tax=Sulfuricurvum sp. TaxID=2025608 RepID=UPI00262F41D5|nr:glycosyltransferase family 9 protein [Sulfuricurvum sp.]MDD2266017.1 glycosyltransferase family 9 protein [Sulfuricurvum sp.]MDD2783029.1 glycosyltransferase family 9 protein [Sulfuricurvum sp.]
MKLWFEKGAWASKQGIKSAGRMSPESVKSIVVIRHAAIGDMMVLRPFLIQTRSFFPNATITLSIVNTYSYGAPVDLVDRIHVVDKKIEGKKTSFFSRLKQIRELEEHDILFDMADTASSAMVSFFAKAVLKIGFPYRRFKNFLFFDVSVLRSDLVPEMEILLHMLHILGAPKEAKIDYGYKVSEKKESRIIYFMGASVPSKQWPKESFSVLIRKMAQAYPEHEHILLEGIGANEKVDDTVSVLADLPNVSKLSALPLEEMIAYLGSSQTVVCNDTGIRNMAIAAETATVGIFFSTVPYRYLPNPQIHTAVFNSDGSIPSVDNVFEALQSVVNRL